MHYNPAGSLSDGGQSYPVLGRGVTLTLQCIDLADVPLAPTVWSYIPGCTGSEETLPNGDNRFEIIQTGPSPGNILEVTDIGRDDPTFCITCCQMDLAAGGDFVCQNFSVRAVGEECNTFASRHGII